MLEKIVALNNALTPAIKNSCYLVIRSKARVIQDLEMATRC